MSAFPVDLDTIYYCKGTRLFDRRPLQRDEPLAKR